MKISDDILMHYGVSKLEGAPGRGSGRYPLGSGDNPYQHSGDFLTRVEELKKLGKTEREIAEELGILNEKGQPSSTRLRAQISTAKTVRKQYDTERAKALRDQGMSYGAIAKELGYPNESSVRSLLNVESVERRNQAQKTAGFLKDQVDSKGMIDVGTGVERYLGVSKEKMDQALYILEEQGYKIYGGGVPQATNPGKQTNLRVLCPPGTEHKEIYSFENIHSIQDFTSHDGGETFDKAWVYPKSLDSKRLEIRYAEDGGVDKDGVIELRRNVEDISLGESTYAQVRIMVDGTHYLKGMAVYADDLPDGIDVRFNTNKKQGTPFEKVLKPIKDDPNNPFGSLIKEGVIDPDDPTKREGGQRYYYDENGEKQLSVINKRADEGDWGEWSHSLPSQFLSKQPKKLVDQQLNLAIADKQAEFDEIMSLTNPTVKKKLLMSFADDCDTAAVHLKAAALPRQKYQVILPLTTIGDDQVYAPNYKDGEKVALIRYPHGGTFEIPILTVNNKNPEGRRVLGTNPDDAVGISKNVADRLSGADFDGDTVMVIPTGGKVKISSKRQLENVDPKFALEGFDPKFEYGGKPEGTFKRMKNTQTEMGIISNLITDMTLLGATDEELARAVRHSMVVIDAEKHGLDYKQSEIDHDIAALHKKYQGRVEDGKYREGAATIISKASSEVDVTKRKGSPKIDPETGKVSYKEVHETYVDDRGKTKERTQKSTKMAETDDAFTLVSEAMEPREVAYANFANTMKSMANEARKEAISTPRLKYSSSAKEVYQQEVDHLKAELNVQLMNKPRERMAQTEANSIVSQKRQIYKQEHPEMSKAEIRKALKKDGQRALMQARQKYGSKRTPIIPTDREWEAIQAGAISDNVLSMILDNSDMDRIRELSMPRSTKNLSDAKVAKIKAMAASNYTNTEIAEMMGISSATVAKYIKGKE